MAAELSVVIPAYNEEKLIASTVHAVAAYISRVGLESEIIVVDDGSTDRTVETVSALPAVIPVRLLLNGRNRGKGYSVKAGMREAHSPFVLFMDADLPYDLGAVDLALAELRGGADLAIGARGHADSRTRKGPPRVRHLAGTIFSLLIQALVMRGIPDTQCGFKAFRQAAASDLFPRLTLERFGFDVELLFLARKYGYLIRTIPVSLQSRDESRVHLFHDSLRMFGDLFRIRLNDWRGLYNRPRQG